VIANGKGKAREGKWLICQAYKTIDDEKLYLHYEGQAGGKAVRYPAPGRFAQQVVAIKPATLFRWLAVFKKFGHDVFVRDGTTKLAMLLTLGPLAGISLPEDPAQVMISIPGKGKKPAIQKPFAECSKEEVAQALRAFKDAPSSKLPEDVGIAVAEATAAYRQAAGAGAPDLLKVRQAKDGAVEMALPAWVPMNRESAKAYLAMAQALVAATEKHAQTLESHSTAASPKVAA